MECSFCAKTFSFVEIERCRRHLSDPFYPLDHGNGRAGVYKCCNQPVVRFKPFQIEDGCHYVKHIPLNEKDENFELFMRMNGLLLNEESRIPVRLDNKSNTTFYKKWDKSKVFKNESHSIRMEKAFNSKPSRFQYDQRKSGKIRKHVLIL